MAQGRTVDRILNENGDIARLCVSAKGKWHIERINEAFSPNPGKVSRRWFKTEKEARDEFENLRLYYIDPEA